VTANSGQRSGIPLSPWKPRSTNEMPEPTTRSVTVRETRISPGRASVAIAAAMSTDSPSIALPRTSTSPVCTPARGSIPAPAEAVRIASAQRMAWPGPSNVATRPSPR
jgi:hypothetical protein